MNKKVLGQGKLNSLFTFQRDVLERRRGRERKGLKSSSFKPAGEKQILHKFRGGQI